MSRREINWRPRTSSKQSTANSSIYLVFHLSGESEPASLWGLRSVVVGTHLIFYTVGPERINIVRVIDGRMDVDEEFQR
jgi:plasmid stabilization system protein ParE